MPLTRLRPALCRILASLVSAALLSGCAGYTLLNPFYRGNGTATEEPARNLEPPPADRPATFWDAARGQGLGQIVVKLGAQRAYFYRGKKMIGATRISTGKKGFSTPPGTYRVTQKDQHHVSTLYGDFIASDGSVAQANVDTGKDHAPEGASFQGAKMPYFLRFRSGYGLHAGRVPNYPASHGCVRLPAEMARHFFEAAEIGTPVRVEE